MNKILNTVVRFIEQIETFKLLHPIGYEDLAGICIVGLVAMWLSGFVFKTLVIFVLRQFGCSTPELYSKFPTLPWRSFYLLKMRVARWHEHIFKFGKQQTGGFASVFAVLTNHFSAGKIFIGRPWVCGFGLFQSIGIKLTKHMLIVAGTGSGKTSTIIASLSKWKGSAFVLDPTSIITSTLARNDKKREWLELSPYEPETTAQINPFDDAKAAVIREGADAAIKWSYRIGESFIKTESNAKQPFFTDTSRGFFVGLFLHILSAHPEEEHNLGVLRELIIHGYKVFDEDGKLLSTPEESRQLLYRSMLNNPAHGGAVAGAASPFINASPETKGNLEATLQEKTKILDIPAVRHFFAKTTRPLSDLKTKNDVVFILNIPLFSLRQELNGVAMLVQNLVFYTFESIKERNGLTLFVTDEAQAQGYNPTLEIAMPTARSQGLIIIVITQDLDGMEAEYKKTYLSFIGNADIVLWMATAHPSNKRRLCSLLGKKTLVTKDRDSGRKTYREVDVMTEEQIERFLSPETGNFIATVAGKRAWRCKLDPFFKSLPVWSYQPDPNHKEPMLRRIGRFFFGLKT
jgi:type IV secretory pathway TraG/TraD family ATPase VirD4